MFILYYIILYYNIILYYEIILVQVNTEKGK